MVSELGLAGGVGAQVITMEMVPAKVEEAREVPGVDREAVRVDLAALELAVAEPVEAPRSHMAISQRTPEFPLSCGQLTPTRFKVLPVSAPKVSSNPSCSPTASSSRTRP